MTRGRAARSTPPRRVLLYGTRRFASSWASSTAPPRPPSRMIRTSVAGGRGGRPVHLTSATGTPERQSHLSPTRRWPIPPAGRGPLTFDLLAGRTAGRRSRTSSIASWSVMVSAGAGSVVGERPRLSAHRVAGYAGRMSSVAVWSGMGAAGCGPIEVFGGRTCGRSHVQRTVGCRPGSRSGPASIARRSVTLSVGPVAACGFARNDSLSLAAGRRTPPVGRARIGGVV